MSMARKQCIDAWRHGRRIGLIAPNTDWIVNAMRASPRSVRVPVSTRVPISLVFHVPLAANGEIDCCAETSRDCRLTDAPKVAGLAGTTFDDHATDHAGRQGTTNNLTSHFLFCLVVIEIFNLLAG
jgi:hypothetical protein